MPVSLLNPYDNLTGGHWLRGNLHTHTTRSDGARPPQEVIDDYAARGYGFLMLSDHDVLNSEQDLKQWDAHGMLLVPGNEITAGGPHLLHVDAVRRIEPGGSRQRILNDVLALERETGRGFAVMNHPDWEARFDHATIEQLREWWGYAGIEIYNGVINRLDGSPYALGKWDMLLSEGRRIWGFANDDLHKAQGDIAWGWNVVYARERTPAGVVEALRAGRFYASTGVVLRSIEVRGGTIRVVAENAVRMAAFQKVGRRVLTVDGPEIEIEAQPNAGYVRIQAWGQGEQMAWTQPFFVLSETEAGGPSKFITEWTLTSLAEGLAIEEATPAHARRDTVTIRSGAPGAKGLYGFADARSQIRGQPGVVFYSAAIESPADRRRTIRLGYDGPVKVWLNGQPIFDGPGRNPAVADSLALTGSFRKGGNALLIAMGTNGGKAWGIFGRLDD